jgi:hypothetical protein
MQLLGFIEGRSLTTIVHSVISVSEESRNWRIAGGRRIAGGQRIAGGTDKAVSDTT